MPRKTSATEEFKDAAHNVWLAGLGAFAAAGSEGEKLFKTLVARGKKVELSNVRVTSTVKQVRARAGASLGGLQSTIDRSVSSALHGIGVPTRKEIAALNRRVEKLTRALDGNGTRKTAKKKARKKAAKKTAKKTAR